MIWSSIRYSYLEHAGNFTMGEIKYAASSKIIPFTYVTQVCAQCIWKPWRNSD